MNNDNISKSFGTSALKSDRVIRVQVHLLYIYNIYIIFYCILVRSSISEKKPSFHLRITSFFHSHFTVFPLHKQTSNHSLLVIKMP